MGGEDYGVFAKSVPSQVRIGRGKAVRSQPMMKNVNEGKGLFAPIVVLGRNIIGKKRFNQIRGKAIALHSQVFSCTCIVCMYNTLLICLVSTILLGVFRVLL